MAHITISRSESGEFELPPACLYCSTPDRLTTARRLLLKGSPLQLLLFAPWLMLGFLDMRHNSNLVGLVVASALIFMAFLQRARVRTSVCADCVASRQKSGFLVAGLVGLGSAVTCLGPFLVSGYLALPGMAIVAGALLWETKLSSRSRLVLLKRDKDQVTLQVPASLPLVWQATTPSL